MWFVSIFYKIYTPASLCDRPVSKIRTWFVTQIQIITKKARHALKGTSGLLYDINIYTPAFRQFEERIAYVSIFYKISSCEQKKNVICDANPDDN